MAMDVQRVLFLILGRKGRTRMKKIWLISLPEKIQAASWLRIPNCFSGLKRDVNKNYHKSQRYTVYIYTIHCIQYMIEIGSYSKFLFVFLVEEVKETFFKNDSPRYFPDV